MTPPDKQEPIEPHRIGVIVVDHGSVRSEANEMLLQFVEHFRAHCDFRIVEAAHMELAEPSIATAFSRCVEQGARHVVVAPYFLSPGKHWEQDIPRLVKDAASSHAGVLYHITCPIGLHPLMIEIILTRVEETLATGFKSTNAPRRA